MNLMASSSLLAALAGQIVLRPGQVPSAERTCAPAHGGFGLECRVPVGHALAGRATADTAAGDSTGSYAQHGAAMATASGAGFSEGPGFAATAQQSGDDFLCGRDDGRTGRHLSGSSVRQTTLARRVVWLRLLMPVSTVVLTTLAGKPSTHKVSLAGAGRACQLNPIY